MNRIIRTGAPILLAISTITAALGADETGHPADRYGEALEVMSGLGIGKCMDAALDGDHLFAIGGGSLHVFDVSQPKAPKNVSRLGGLGKVRQLAIADGIACVTAREDGMFIVDVDDPKKPRIVCHYDTIELATGIAISGSIAFVACRQAGVELVDISDPRRPVHLSTVHTGEAQSVAARNGFIYAGVWASSELVVCDVRNPHEPAITARLPLDGYGDGVDVRGNYCYVATGHHSRARPRAKPGDPGHGRGHGLEIFELSDPAVPVFVSRLKTPAFYAIHNDTWRVNVSGRHAFVGDTHNGLFVVDVGDPEKPRFVAHRQLDYNEDENAHSPVSGLAIGDGVVYVAGAWSDLHVIAAAGMANRPATEEGRAPIIGERPAPKKNPRYRVYRPNGQVYGVAMAGDVALVAAGMAGVHALRLFPEIEKLGEFPTRGFAMGVAVHGDLVLVSEGNGGLSTWRWPGGGKMEPLGRYAPRNMTVKQVELPAPGRYALLQAGSNRLHILDLADPAEPKLVLEDKHPGLLYYHPIASGLMEDRYAACFWHVSGTQWYSLTADGGPKPSGDTYPFRTGSRNGMAMINDRAIQTWRNGYVLVERGETRGPEELPKFTITGHPLSGKVTISGQRLICADRYGGKVVAVDITDVTKPKFIAELDLREHPSPVVVHDGIPLIPGGYDGLLIWDELGP